MEEMETSPKTIRKPSTIASSLTLCSIPRSNGSSAPIFIKPSTHSFDDVMEESKPEKSGSTEIF